MSVYMERWLPPAGSVYAPYYFNIFYLTLIIRHKVHENAACNPIGMKHSVLFLRGLVAACIRGNGNYSNLFHPNA